MSRRKQQNPKPLVALKQAEDEPAEKPSRCEEAGSMMKGELLMEEAGERDGGELLSHADESCGGGGGCGEQSSPGSSSLLPSAAASAGAAADSMDLGVPIEASGIETEFNAPTDIIKIVRIKGEHRILSRAHLAADSGCGPFMARHVPQDLVEQWQLQRPTNAEAFGARLLKFYRGDYEHWFLLETMEGQWLRFLDRPKQGQAANVAIHFIDNTLWLGVMQPLKPDDELIAELGRDPDSSSFASASPPQLADGRSPPTRPLQSAAAAATGRSDPSNDAVAATEACLGASDEGERSSAEVACGPRRPARTERADCAAVATGPSLLAAFGTAAGDRLGQPNSSGPAPLTCRTCGVTFRSQRTLEAHEAYYCSKAASITAGTAAAAAAAAASAAAAAAASAAASPAGVAGTESALLREDVRHSPVDLKPPPALVPHRMPAAPLPETDESAAAEVFQCQLCKHVTRSWTAMRAHARDHVQQLHAAAPLAATVLRCPTDVARAASSPGRSDPERQASSSSSASYCANCDIQFMSVENYDIHRQHYCGSRRGRAPAASIGSGGSDTVAATGHGMAAATTARSPSSSSRSPSPLPPQPPLPPLHHNRKTAVHCTTADGATGSRRLLDCGADGGRGNEPSVAHWSLAEDRDASQLTLLRGTAPWLHRDAGLLRLAAAAAARPADRSPADRSPSASRGSSPQAAAAAAPVASSSSSSDDGDATAALTISIPAVLSVPAPIVDGGITCGGRSSLPGRLIIGSLQSPDAAATTAGNASAAASVSLEVPASIIQRAMAATQQRQQEGRNGSEQRGSTMAAVVTQAASPVPRAHRDGPLDLSMKCLKRKPSPSAYDDADDYMEQRRPAKAVAPPAATATAATAAPRLPLTPKTALGHGGATATAALLSKCVECNILFYKHENYIAHKTHYCPARHREVVLPAARDSGETGGSSCGSGGGDKYEPLAAIATAAAAAAAVADKPRLLLLPGAHETPARRQTAFARAPEQPEAVADDASRDGSADELPDDRLVITYACNKCGRSFTTLHHFKVHACSSRGADVNAAKTTMTAEAAAAEGAAAAAARSRCCLGSGGRSDDDVPSLPGRSFGGPAITGGEATSTEPTSTLVVVPGSGGLLRRGGGGAGGGLAVVNCSAYVCSICGYHGNTVRGMRLHGRYHVDRGETWSEACIIESGPPSRGSSGGGVSSAAMSLSPASSLLAGSGGGASLGGLLLLQQRQQLLQQQLQQQLRPTPSAEEELLRLKNEPYKKRKSRKSYQLLYSTAVAMAASPAAPGTAATDVGAFARYLASSRGGGGMRDECSEPSSAAAVAVTPEPLALDSSSSPPPASWCKADDGSPMAPVAVSEDCYAQAAGSEAPATSTGDSPPHRQSASDTSAAQVTGGEGSAATEAAKTPTTLTLASASAKVKVEPSGGDEAAAAASSSLPAAAHGTNSNNTSSSNGGGGSESRRSLSTQKRHVCSHCNVGFMYPSSFDAHVKFYCPSSRAAAGVAATGN